MEKNHYDNCNFDPNYSHKDEIAFICDANIEQIMEIVTGKKYCELFLINAHFSINPIWEKVFHHWILNNHKLSNDLFEKYRENVFTPFYKLIFGAYTALYATMYEKDTMMDLVQVDTIPDEFRSLGDLILMKACKEGDLKKCIKLNKIMPFKWLSHPCFLEALKSGHFNILHHVEMFEFPQNAKMIKDNLDTYIQAAGQCNQHAIVQYLKNNYSIARLNSDIDANKIDINPICSGDIA